jgi:hypothetical protein
LEIYRPHMVDATILRKRTKEDRIFQLLASLNREECRRKVMSCTISPCNPSVSAYLARPYPEGKVYKGKRSDLKCQHCHNIGHTIDRCWSLHPEIKPKFNKDQKGKSVA